MPPSMQGPRLGRTTEQQAAPPVQSLDVPALTKQQQSSVAAEAEALQQAELLGSYDQLIPYVLGLPKEQRRAAFSATLEEVRHELALMQTSEYTFCDLMLAKLWPAAAASTAQPIPLPASWLGLLASVQQQQLGQLVNLMQFNWRSEEAVALGDGLLQQPALLKQFLKGSAQMLQQAAGDLPGSRQSSSGPAELEALDIKLQQEEQDCLQHLAQLEQGSNTSEAVDVGHTILEAGAVPAEHTSGNDGPNTSTSCPSNTTTHDHQQEQQPCLGHPEHLEQQDPDQQAQQQTGLPSSSASPLSEQLVAIRARRARLLHAVERKLVAASQQLLCLLLRLCWRMAAAHLNAATADTRGTHYEASEGSAQRPAGVEAVDQHKYQQHQQVSMPSCSVLGSAPACAAGALEACKLVGDGAFVHVPAANKPASTAVVHTESKSGLERASADCCCRSDACRYSRQAVDTWVAELQECVADLAGKLATVQADYEQQLLEGQLAAEQHAQQLWAETSARHEQKLAQAKQEAARVRGEPAVLQGITAEELQVLAAELEGALAAVRVAQVQAAAERERQCPICLDAQKSVAFQCGHQACDSCADKVASCPCCRTVISLRIKLY